MVKGYTVKSEAQTQKKIDDSKNKSFLFDAVSPCPWSHHAQLFAGKGSNDSSEQSDDMCVTFYMKKERKAVVSS